jgi:hypothetical protein
MTCLTHITQPRDSHVSLHAARLLLQTLKSPPRGSPELTPSFAILPFLPSTRALTAFAPWGRSIRKARPLFWFPAPLLLEDSPQNRTEDEQSLRMCLLLLLCCGLGVVTPATSAQLQVASLFHHTSITSSILFEVACTFRCNRHSRDRCLSR